MMERDPDEPFSRESWQRRLRDGDDAPSESTDLRIQAEARRALASRPVRWWVPASLAASFVLVVMLVQSQYAGFVRQQSIGEGDFALDEAQPKPAIILNAPAEEGDASAITAAPAAAPTAPPAAAEPDQWSGFSRPADVVPPAKVDVPAPMMDESPTTAISSSPPPAREEVETLELKRERVLKQDRADAPVSAAQEAEATSDRGFAIGNLEAAKSSGKQARTPEEWYAEIEALRTAGRIEEAQAELRKLEAAHPGWLAEHHQPKP